MGNTENDGQGGQRQDDAEKKEILTVLRLSKKKLDE